MPKKKNSCCVASNFIYINLFVFVPVSSILFFSHISLSTDASHSKVFGFVWSVNARRSHPPATGWVTGKVQAGSDSSTEGMKGRIDGLPNSSKAASPGTRRSSLRLSRFPFAASISHEIFEYRNIEGKRIVHTWSRKFICHEDTVEGKLKDQKIYMRKLCWK